MMKATKYNAIVFHCIDNFGKTYEFVETCRKGKEAQTIAKAEAKSTEIISHDIRPLYVEDKAEKLFNAIFK